MTENKDGMRFPNFLVRITRSFSKFPRLNPDKEHSFLEAIEAFRADVRLGAVEYMDESRRRAVRTAELARITFFG